MRHGTCFHHRLSAHPAGAAPHSAVAELGVVRRFLAHTLMAPPKKDTSIQARFGFADEDKRTPLHDEIQIWIDRYAQQIFALILRLNSVWRINPPRWEHWIRNNRGFEIGAADILITGHHPNPDAYPSTATLVVEAKGKIESLGTLIRQIRLYQTGNWTEYPRTNWLVVSPDTQYATMIEGQGIHFLAYDPARTFTEIGDE